MKILFSGGGTAGHINPALAVAGYVREQQPDVQILYVGAKGGMEERLVAQAGFDFRGITISGFQRKPSLQNLKKNLQTVAHLFTATAESKKILREFQPDICMGTGGYVAGPVIREALKLHIPAVIHEQNAFPGVTNKALSRNADRVMLASADAEKYMAKNARCVLTGNPVRMAVIRADRQAARRRLGLDSRPLVLSFGGSLGAQKINEAILDLLQETAKTDRFQHIHAYGKYGGWFPEKLKARGVDPADHPNFDIRPYIDDMPDCLAAADLVICRAGAITLSELQAKGRAALIIPSPNVAENHQYFNAMSMVNRKAADILEEKDLSGSRLTEKVEALFQNPDTIPALAENARKMAILDTNERIFGILKEVLGERRAH
ncbi:MULTISPECIES: undecaprenyldiphospho-muramoylpentapeptide beta-N-acetylglucosaminyltransferase [Caproicibacterium]|uniref:UDP-N-acetylglucosamine--N-acetylmuramyl-(pentapeptide) pyrophosphoryl-undecaprenol N-acetylglucosamine transferase n=1 Tax=Caproicibacterium argilliputei TaxID=3030016 RepID=A0AA97D8N3_9FIRM|nr:undecaprenyldiphospho-muramoylpentapeptide beta-N-acetylglucosaminyltransferase [Caproicibacterium argilliputei]WOC31507.1 undecaprenyldiphospho-muramoylpentapeptide beta-N-acetylglucosaminyltransferase [Caproicibacterium argilliputei]